MHFLKACKVVLIILATCALFRGFANGMGFCAFKKKFPSVKENGCDSTRSFTGAKVANIKASTDLKGATSLMVQTTGGDKTKQPVINMQTNIQSTSNQQTTDSAAKLTSNIAIVDQSASHDAFKSQSPSHDNISYKYHTIEWTNGSSFIDLLTSNNPVIDESTLDQQTTIKWKAVKLNNNDSLTHQSDTSNLAASQITLDKVTTNDQLTTRDAYSLAERLTTKGTDSITPTFDQQTAARSNAVKSTIDSSLTNRFTINHTTNSQSNYEQQSTVQSNPKSESTSDTVTKDTTKTADGVYSSTYAFTTKDTDNATTSDQEAADRFIPAYLTNDTLLTGKLKTNPLVKSQSTPNRSSTIYSTIEKMDSINTSTKGIPERHSTSIPSSFDNLTKKEPGSNEGSSTESPGISQIDISPFNSHKITLNQSTVGESYQTIGVPSSPDQLISETITAEQTASNQITSRPTSIDQKEFRPSTVTANGPFQQNVFIDCSDIRNAGYNESRVYSILPSGWNGSLFHVYCDMITDGGGWTVFQRRVNGSTNFYKTWTDYRDGFGDMKHEFWLGNEKLHILSHQGKNELRIDFLHSSTLYYTKYSSFQIGNESNKYIVTDVGAKSGNGGSMYYTQGEQFSTYDQDNDGVDCNCAEKHRGGWWYGGWEARWSSSFCYSWQDESHYRTCSCANLNGDYNGRNGENIFDILYCNISYTEMKIRRAP